MSTPNRYGIWVILRDFIFRKIFLSKEDKYLVHYSTMSLDSFKKLLYSNDFKIEMIYSPEGIGFIAFIRSLIIKLTELFLSRKIIFQNRFYELFHKAECRISKVFPLAIHHSYVIKATK